MNEEFKYEDCFKILLENNLPTTKFYIDMLWGLKNQYLLQGKNKPIKTNKAIQLIKTFRGKNES